jgi:hypothetical protein
LPTQIETASSVSNPVREKEVEMEEAPEAPMATEPEQVIDTERGITDERMSDSNELESNETKMTDAQVERPSRAAEERATVKLTLL